MAAGATETESPPNSDGACISCYAYLEAASPAEKKRVKQRRAWGRAMWGLGWVTYSGLGKMKTFGERVLLAVPDVPVEHPEQRIKGKHSVRSSQLCSSM